MRDEDYLKFLREEGRCLACQLERSWGGGEHPEEVYREWQRRLIDPMHGPVNGTSSKGPDDEAMPGCRHHHDEQTAIGWPAFETRYGFLRADEARVWRTAYLIYKEHIAC